MKFNVWGCRGSIARSHPSIIRYGGNTPCCEIEADDGTRIVLDMGSGAYDLGQKLVKLGPLQNQHVLITHTHWDHIQGFPFFCPLFIPGSKWNIHAPGGFSSSLKDKLSSQMSHEFFPLTIDQFGADINYHDLKEGELNLGSIRVTTQYINHTVLTLGYRLEDETSGASIAYITDHEPFDHRLATEGYQRKTTEDNADDHGKGGAMKTPDDRHADFFAGVDLLVHDTQYTASQYHKHEGWGHSTVEYVVDMAMAVNVKQLALFHHDPQRTDEQVDEIVQMAQERVKKTGGTLKVFAAADNMSLDIEAASPEQQNMVSHVPSNGLTRPKVLPERKTPSPEPSEANSRRGSALTTCNNLQKNILISQQEKETVFKELQADGLCVSSSDQNEMLEAAKKTRPALLLVSFTEGESLLQMNKRLRQEFGDWGKEVPFIIVAHDQQQVEELRSKASAMDMTDDDWDAVVEPFSPAYIRTRIRMALSRNPCKWVPPVMPKNESNRQAALLSLDILDSPPEERFDRITRTCAAVFDVPYVFISLVDENRQWFKSTAWRCPVPEGGTPSETSREVSFCGHAINQNDLFIIPDATQDERFAHNPLVQEGLKIRFYAGCPLAIRNVQSESDTEFNIGTLCIIDDRPRDIDESQKDLLRDFAAMVKREMFSIPVLRRQIMMSQVEKQGSLNGGITAAHMA